MMLDDIDIRILKLLQTNSSLTTKDLAAKVNLSTTPVFERVKRLEKNGYIKNYIAVLDAEKLNKGLMVFCNVTLKEHTREIGNQFVKDILLLKEVVECYNISGDYDFLLKIVVSDMKEYQNFVLDHLGGIKNIGSAHSTFVMGEIKNTYAVPI
ncbi:Lrp/AsnC family transcriptional regulator [Tamlana sp. s12]|uniref:Lrp/AsnC family transcriptional regulator n=1 Tax=Tamlana sp. s12 TaxID=1630406 RepID=UPI0007FFAB1A|nr:Lrp/AsnC family transcriptional regulator [Tamlana sp. s12]OBQ56657.1 AsnC family transcriptional regulator [Tamlana sp. s12]QQY81702.1 Lrp/AsnC family transcriptional regulator [Tamlana sp. s12]